MAVVKVRARGQLTIPASLRKELHIEDEVPLSIVKVGAALLLTAQPLRVDAVARKAQREMKKAGLDLEDLLADLDRQRSRYTKQGHGA